jgi:signal transduction histidine kinase
MGALSYLLRRPRGIATGTGVQTLASSTQRVRVPLFDRLALRWRLALISFGVLVLLLGVLNVFLYVTLRHFMMAELLRALDLRAHLLERQIANFAATETSPIGDLVRLTAIVNLRSVAGVEVIVFDRNGEVLVRSRGAPDTLPPYDARRIQELATARPGELHERWDASTRETWGGIWMPLDAPTTSLGAALLAVPVDRVESTLRTLLLVMGIGDAVAIVLAMALHAPLVGAALRPLQKVAATARRIASGDYSQRVNLAGYADDEVAQLARSFDEMAERIQAAFEAQRRFIADASHELRTPLAALDGTMEVLLRGALNDPPTAHRMLRMAHAELQRMSRLVNDLLTLTRMDARPVLKRQPLDLGELLEEVLIEVAPLNRGQEVRLQRSGSLSLIGDVDGLRSVFVNLVGNALKFTQPGDRVMIKAQRNGAAIEVEVRDTGPGIPAQDLPHIFDRFYRGSTSRSRQEGGTGLGLAIAKAVVEAHNGTISASNHPEGGALLRVALPLAPLPAAAPT